MRSALPVLGVLALALSGCFASNDPADPVDPMAGYTSPDDPIPAEGVGDHDHRDPAQHRFARNATLLGHDDLRRFGWTNESVVGAHALDLHGDLLVVGVNAGEVDDGQQGFHLFDVSEPGQPRHLSYYAALFPVAGDRTVTFSGDGRYVFLGYEGGGVRPGVSAVDVSDPTAPVEVAFWADPQDYGAHTVAAGVVDGVQYVFVLAMGVNILRFDGTTFTLVGKYLTADQLAFADAARLLVGDGQGSPQTYALRALYGHDMTFFDDPVSGKPLLLVAYAYEGLKVLDLSQPSAPILLTRWMPPADTPHKHYTHSVAASRMPDGQLLLVVGSETFEPENQAIASPVWILDATAAVLAPPLTQEPIYRSTWRNPGGAAAGNLGLSVHFFRIDAGILYLSHYHGGVWAIGLRTPAEQADPPVLGYIMPIPEGAVEPPEDCCIGFDLDGAPMVFDVVARDGVAYGADIIQGLTAIQFSATGP
ncbi:MAG: hypothetical protein AABY18_01510 [Candidatus Thermoplasmatota archaeon]